jgi:hypothetical protein
MKAETACKQRRDREAAGDPFLAPTDVIEFE